GKVDIATALSLYLDMKLGACLGIDIDARVGGVLKMNADLEFEFEAVGLSAKTKSPLEARVDALEADIKTLQVKI
ncbi:MAG: hypothetical protein U9N77_01400, partial [Thermodesulfobacteriota bacterium]|nr:hypothetical protein [Thermodesulfobacteriota bacterium]